MKRGEKLVRLPILGFPFAKKRTGTLATQAAVNQESN